MLPPADDKSPLFPEKAGNPETGQPPAVTRQSDNGNIGSLLAFRTSRNIERNPLVFFQGFETVRLDGRKMGENIFATFVRSDESETLGIVKPFYSTSCHYKFPISIKPGFRLYHRLKQKQK